MKARSVSKRAAFRLGALAFAVLLDMGVLPALNATETTITVTGTSNGGRDMFGVFAMPKNSIPLGTPFTLVFTFDDSKGHPFGGGPCASSGTGIVGNGKDSPGHAVLTINGKSYEWGNRPDARSRAWRSVPSSCSNSELGISVQEGQGSLVSGITIKVSANRGKALTGDKDWRGAVTLSDFDARNGDNAFVIRNPGNYSAESMSYLSITKVTVTRAGAKTSFLTGGR